MSEVAEKLKTARESLKKYSLGSLRFRGVDWFAWITGGGNSSVIMTAEEGVAEVFVTADKAWILTTPIEKNRLLAEELTADFEVMAFPWEDPNLLQDFIQTQTQGRVCASDRPRPSEVPLPWDLRIAKTILRSEEIERYRVLGREAAEAMTEALMSAKPEWTENRLAGEGARALWTRGIEPTLVLVSGERRGPLYRHPVAKAELLGDRAMMVFCGRRHGLYANLTRFVFFRPLRAVEEAGFEAVLRIEAAAFNALMPGKTLASLYGVLAGAYADLGHADEIHHHHQGGNTGYLSREQVLRPDLDPRWTVENHMALALNPSLPGFKIEDTVVMSDHGLEVLTVDSAWPTEISIVKNQNLPRPKAWVKS